MEDKILEKFKKENIKLKKEFSGSCPPEIFVGREGYPKVFTGILSPQEHGDTSYFSMPEEWFSKKAQIIDILGYRSRMIYSRFYSSIKPSFQDDKLKRIMQEVAMTSVPVSMEFKLKKKPSINFSSDYQSAIIGNPAPLIEARFQENPKIEKKVDYLVSDIDVKSVQASEELYKAKIPVSHIIKLLSAGLLGLKKNRKLVPTRWAITATDSHLSELLLEKIRYYPFLQEFRLFNSEYLGNHYEILLIPSELSFEVIEAKFPGSIWNQKGREVFAVMDSEGFHGRKDYAENVVGGYYVARLAAAEYLNAIKTQASVLVWRECLPEYWAPCGVGVLRETCRDAFNNEFERFDSLGESLGRIQERLRINIDTFTNKSRIVKEYKIQRKLMDFFK